MTKHTRNTLLLLAGSLIALVAGGVFLWAASLRLPEFNVINDRKIEQSTKIYDRTGEILLNDVHQDIRRTVVPFDQVSRNIKNATVAIEDAEFYEHIGIKPTAIIRAVLTNLISGELKFNISAMTIEAKEGIFEGNVKIFVHDKEELDELVNRLIALPGIERVDRYDTE